MRASVNNSNEAIIAWIVAGGKAGVKAIDNFGGEMFGGYYIFEAAEENTDDLSKALGIVYYDGQVTIY